MDTECGHHAASDGAIEEEAQAISYQARVALTRTRTRTEPETEPEPEPEPEPRLLPCLLPTDQAQLESEMDGLLVKQATHHAPRTTHHAPRTTHHTPRTTHHAHRHGSRRGSRRPSFSAMPLGVSAIDANALGGRLAEMGPLGRPHQVSVGDAHAGAGAEADAGNSPRAHGGVHDGWPPPVDTTGDWGHPRARRSLRRLSSRSLPLALLPCGTHASLSSQPGLARARLGAGCFHPLLSIV